MGELIYLDNSATSFPKPQEVHEYMFDFYSKRGLNPGRSGYDASWEVEDIVLSTRKTLKKFFNGEGDPERLVFSYNASDSLNIIVQGIVKKGDHVISTTLEHNSVLRPLYVFSDKVGFEVDYVPFNEKGYIDPDDIKAKIKKNTKLVIINHCSNVLGTVQPIGEIGKICREHGVLLAVDAAQSAGIIPIDMQRDNIDVISFTGHKSLYGPTGIGGLFVNEGVNIDTIRPGGTGVKSKVRTHLEEYPFRLECGTLNILGVAGLFAGQKFIEHEGLDNIHKKEMALFKRLRDGIKDVPGITMYCADSLENRVSVLSINIGDYSAGDVGTFLDVDYNIAVRTGLQCAPLVHEGIGTSPKGTVRFSIGYFNTEKDIDTAIEAVTDIALRNNKA